MIASHFTWGSSSSCSTYRFAIRTAASHMSLGSSSADNRRLPRLHGLGSCRLGRRQKSLHMSYFCSAYVGYAVVGAIVGGKISSIMHSDSSFFRKAVAPSTTRPKIEFCLRNSSVLYRTEQVRMASAAAPTNSCCQ